MDDDRTQLDFYTGNRERERSTRIKDEAPCKCALKSIVIHEGTHVQARVRERERESPPFRNVGQSNSKKEEKKKNDKIKHMQAESTEQSFGSFEQQRASTAIIKWNS